LSPLLGNPLPGGGTAALNSPASYSPTSSSTGNLNSMASTPGGGGGKTSGYQGLLPGTKSLEAALRQQFPQLGEIGGVRKDAHPDHPSGRALDIMIPGGTVRGGANPQGRMLGDQMWNWLMSTGMVDPKGSLWKTDTGGDHWNHIHARLKEGMEQAGFSGASASMTGMPGAGSGVVPVFVTNFGGMGAGGGGGGLAALFGGGGAAPTGLGPGGSHLANWDAIMGAEAGGSGGWQANTGNGFYGGLQFTQSSWDAAKPPGAPERADLATPEQQKAAGDKLLQMQGPGAWPATSAAHPQWFKPTVPTAPGGANPANATTAGATAPSPYTGNPANVGSNTPSGLLPSSADPSKIGGLAPIAPNPGGQGIGIMPGGTIDAAIQGGLNAAGGAAGMFGGGAGGAAAAAAAQTIMKLANRAIQFGGQAAGIGVSGLMETFLPTGGSELANNNWLTRIAGGIAAAAPALPNLAGGALGEQQQQGPLTPEQVAASGNQHGMGQGQPPGPVVGGDFVLNTFDRNTNSALNDANHHLGQIQGAQTTALQGAR
jgi:hypothetical protein